MFSSKISLYRHHLQALAPASAAEKVLRGALVVHAGCALAALLAGLWLLWSGASSPPTRSTCASKILVTCGASALFPCAIIFWIAHFTDWEGFTYANMLKNFEEAPPWVSAPC